MTRLGFVVMLLVFTGCNSTLFTAKEDLGRLNQIAEIFLQGDTEKAIVEMEDYLNSFPNDDQAWTILGNMYEEEDRIDEAQAAFESALKLNPRKFEALTGLGILHRHRGDYDEAMKAYESALKIDGTYAQAYTSMVTIALKRNEDLKALEYARKAYDLENTNPAIAANLAIAYHYNNDPENRDALTRVAEQLGYDKIEVLYQIYSGELTVRD